MVANAAKGEPQVITKRGREIAVMISIKDYKRLKIKEKPLSEFLLDNLAHKYGTTRLDLTRSKDMGRPTLDFSEE